MEKILAFIDLLGFSKMVESDYNNARRVLNDFYNISFSIIKQDQRVNGSLFSDSLLAHSADYPALINCITEIYRKCLKKNSVYASTSKFFLLPRGAISVGYVNIEDRETSPNLTKDFIVSPALVHSAKLEQNIKGSRLLIAIKKDNNQQVQDIVWNDGIKSILYENSSFKFWNNYQYSDALWFLDLKKKADLQKEEVTELVKISIKLVKDNSKNDIALEHHVNTLRIGLLSYSKFLEREDDVVLKEVIKEFVADKYWLLWLTVFEIITNARDPWIYTASDRIISYYKRCSLKIGWKMVIEEINTPGQEYLKNSIRKFLDELKIQTTGKH